MWGELVQQRLLEQITDFLIEHLVDCAVTGMTTRWVLAFEIQNEDRYTTLAELRTFGWNSGTGGVQALGALNCSWQLVILKMYESDCVHLCLKFAIPQRNVRVFTYLESTPPDMASRARALAASASRCLCSKGAIRYLVFITSCWAPRSECSRRFCIRGSTPATSVAASIPR